MIKDSLSLLFLYQCRPEETGKLYIVMRQIITYILSNYYRYSGKIIPFGKPFLIASVKIIVSFIASDSVYL